MIPVYRNLSILFKEYIVTGEQDQPIILSKLNPYPLTNNRKQDKQGVD